MIAPNVSRRANLAPNSCLAISSNTASSALAARQTSTRRHGLLNSRPDVQHHHCNAEATLPLSLFSNSTPESGPGRREDGLWACGLAIARTRETICQKCVQNEDTDPTRANGEDVSTSLLISAFAVPRSRYFEPRRKRAGPRLDNAPAA